MEYGDYQSYADYHGAEFSQARWMRQKKRDMIFPLPLSILKAMRFQSKMRSKALKACTRDCLRGAAGNRNGRSGALRFRYSRDQRKKTRWIRPASGPQSPQRVLLRHHQSRLRQKKQSRNMSRTFFLPVLLLLFMVSKQNKIEE